MDNTNGKMGHRHRERRNQLRIQKRNALQKEIDKGERDLIKQQRNKKQRERSTNGMEGSSELHTK